MLIQRKNPKHSSGKPRLSHRAQLCLLIAYTIAVLFTGALLFNTDSIEQSKQLLSESLDSVKRKVTAIGEEIDSIELHVKFKDVERLNKQRAKALEHGVLVVDDQDYVKADLAINDESAPVTMRLKGDLTDHLAGDKWSFRVICRGENTLLGMKQFSLHRPEARNFIHEWLFHKILKSAGIIGLRYEFVDLHFNGKYWGIYAIEEHFEKRLIEHNHRREGPIVRWDESMFWSDVIATDGRVNGDHHAAAYISTKADAFQTAKYAESEVLQTLHDRALEQLDAFKSEKLTAGQAFNCDLLGKYFAICDVFGAQHATTWNNMRFYFNPVSQLLEPIGFDADAGLPIQRIGFTSNIGASSDTQRQKFHNQLASDIQFTSAYYKWLSEYANESIIEEWESEYQGATARYETLIQAEYPHYKFSWDTVRRNQEFVREQLRRKPKPIANALIRGSYHFILAANHSPVPITCQSVRIGDQVIELEATTLPGRNPGDIVQFLEIEIPDSTAVSGNSCELQYSTATGTEGLVSLVFAADPTSLLPRNSGYQVTSLANLEYIDVDRKSKIATIRQGQWTINGPLVMPAGYELHCHGNTTLTMANNSRIETRGAVRFIGSAASPIVVTSAKGDAAHVLIKDGQRDSILEHVHFSNFSHTPAPGTNITGAVTFYNSPVNIAHCSFNHMQAEDSLNLIRSTVSVSNTRFQNAMSDALDIDFCTGRLTNLTFDTSGNDAIDLSGSSIEIDSAIINNASDKAISCGEASVLRAINIQITDCEVGVTSKDSSDVILTDSNIQNTGIGLMAFRKKSEFGPGDLAASQTNISASKYRYLLEAGSSIMINRQSQPTNAKDIRFDLYDN